MVEHYLDTVGVRGSNPLSRTIFFVTFFTVRFFLSIAITAFLSLSIERPSYAKNEDKNLDQTTRVKGLAVYSRRPKYSRSWPEGSGVVLLHVDRKTGLVTNAEMAESTGHEILDQSALEAFRQWRFKPGTVSKVRAPISFSHHLRVRNG